MYRIQFPRFIASTLFAAGLAGYAFTATAASHCKGMPQNACSADSQCAWVEGYQRKDGRAVSSHCKLKRGKQTSQAGQSQKMAASRGE